MYWMYSATTAGLKFPLVRSRVASQRCRFYILQICWTLLDEDVMRCAGLGAVSVREIELYGSKGIHIMAAPGN